MTIRLTADFRRRFDLLPAEARLEAASAGHLWRTDPHIAALALTQVGSHGMCAIRFSLDWRALALQNEMTLDLFWIGSHAEYDSLLKQL